MTPTPNVIGFNFGQYILLYIVPAVISSGLISILISYVLNRNFTNSQEKKRLRFEKGIQDIIHKRNLLESWATPLIETLTDIHISLDKPELVSSELLAQLSGRASLFISNIGASTKDVGLFNDKIENLKLEIMNYRDTFNNAKSTTWAQDIIIKGSNAKKLITEITKLVNRMREK